MKTNSLPAEVTLKNVEVRSAWLCPKAVEVWYQGQRLFRVALSAKGTHVRKSHQNKLIVLDGHDRRRSLKTNFRWCSGHANEDWTPVVRHISQVVREANKGLRPTDKLG